MARPRGAKREYRRGDFTIFLLKGKGSADWYMYIEGPIDCGEDREFKYFTKWYAINEAHQLIFKALSN